MNFNEAYKEMENGKKIRRKGWGGYWFLNDGIVNIRLKDGCIKTDNFTQETIPNTLADDWEVVEERKVWKPRKSNSFFAIRATTVGCLTRFRWDNFPFYENMYSHN